MNPNDNSAINGFTVTSSEGISQGAVEGGTTSSATIVPKADTSSPPLRIAGAITPEGEIVPVPTDPTIPRSPFNIVNPVTHEVWIQLTEPTDSSKVEEAAPAASPPKTGTSSEYVNQGSAGVTTSSALAAPSSHPFRIVGALSPDGREVPLPDDPNIPRSPFEIVNPVTHEAWIQLTEPTDSSKVEEAAPAASPPKNYSPMVSSQSEAQSEFFVLKRNQLSDIQFWEVVKVIVTEKWVVKYRSKLYMLNDGIYVPLDKRTLVTKTIRRIMNMFNFEPESCSICLNILDEALCRVTEFYGQANDERYTRFRNGYFDNATGRFYINVYDYFPTMQVEADFLCFGTQLNHSLTDRFFDTIAGGDSQIVKVIWQVLGYCMSSDATAKVIIMLIGESGDNGKSTFLTFLQSFITYTGVKNLSMKNLTGSRFSPSELTDWKYI